MEGFFCPSTQHQRDILLCKTPGPSRKTNSFRTQSNGKRHECLSRSRKMFQWMENTSRRRRHISKTRFRSADTFFLLPEDCTESNGGGSGRGHRGCVSTAGARGDDVRHRFSSSKTQVERFLEANFLSSDSNSSIGQVGRTLHMYDASVSSSTSW